MRDHIKQASRNCNRWGYYATLRYLCNRTGCNMATAVRCLNIALLIEGR